MTIREWLRSKWDKVKLYYNAGTVSRQRWDEKRKVKKNG